MSRQHSYCSFCGAPFTSRHWPRSCTHCGKTTYLNPLPVVVAMVPIGSGLVVIRRDIEPQKGELTLPGGYIDFGETWQLAASRELHEETGISLPAGDFSLFDVMNGLDNTLVIFGLAPTQPRTVLKPFSSHETQEVLLIDGPVELGFPNHTEIVRRYYDRPASRSSEP